MARSNPLRTAGNLARRLTGFAVPLFGVSLNPPADQRERVRAFLTFLEDRRVLYNPRWVEVESQVTDSVCQIRKACTAACRSARRLECCRSYPRHSCGLPALPQRWTAAGLPHMGRHMRHGQDAGFFTALGELRAAQDRAP
jgi:hypothetical protein